MFINYFLNINNIQVYIVFGVIHLQFNFQFVIFKNLNILILLFNFLD